MDKKPRNSLKVAGTTAGLGLKFAAELAEQGVKVVLKDAGEPPSDTDQSSLDAEEVQTSEAGPEDEKNDKQDQGEQAQD